MNLKKLSKNKKGFTLVELLVVIAIIAIMAAVVAPNAFKMIERAQISAIEADYKTFKTATLIYRSDTGVWPADGSGETGFVLDDSSTGWDGPYIETWKATPPLGSAYSIFNGVLDTNPDAVYLKIDELPESATEKLTENLGTSLVFTSEDDTYLKIADK